MSTGKEEVRQRKRRTEGKQDGNRFRARLLQLLGTFSQDRFQLCQRTSWGDVIKPENSTDMSVSYSWQSLLK